MEKQNITLKCSTSNGIYALLLIFVLSIIVYAKTFDPIYNELYFIKKEYSNSLVVTKNDSFIFGKSIIIKPFQGNVKLISLRCQDIHYNLINVGDIIYASKWIEFEN